MPGLYVTLFHHQKQEQVCALYTNIQSRKRNPRTTTKADVKPCEFEQQIIFNVQLVSHNVHAFLHKKVSVWTVPEPACVCYLLCGLSIHFTLFCVLVNKNVIKSDSDSVLISGAIFTMGLFKSECLALMSAGHQPKGSHLANQFRRRLKEACMSPRRSSGPAHLEPADRGR